MRRPACCIRPPTATARWATASPRPGWSATCTSDCGAVSSPSAPAGKKSGSASVSSTPGAALSPTLQPGTGRRPAAARTAHGKPSPWRNRSRESDLLKKALIYLLFAALALILTAAVAAFLILKVALAPGRDEWPARFQAGPVAVDVGVPTAIRLATSSWFAPWLAGRTLETAHGPVRFGWIAASET